MGTNMNPMDVFQKVNKISAHAMRYFIQIMLPNVVILSVTDRTWVITECWNMEGFFLEITEVLSEVRMTYINV